jgi:hypothetical protein
LEHDPLTFQLTTGASVGVVESIGTGVPGGASKVSGLHAVVGGGEGLADCLPGVRDNSNNATPTTTAATAAPVASFRRLILGMVARCTERPSPCYPAAEMLPTNKPLKAAPIVLTTLDAILSTRTSRVWPTKLGGAVLVFLVALAAAACSSGQDLTAPRLLTARQLTTRILPAPYDYEVDPTPHASGAITRALFDQFGGVRSPSKLGFVAGFKQNYLNPSTDEGLIVTVIEFKSSRDASAYFAQTRPSTLSYARATLKPFIGVPGAFEAAGTKPYNHGYYHAIVDTAKNFYFQVAYATPESSSAPVELGSWAGLEYTVLKRS